MQFEVEHIDDGARFPEKAVYVVCRLGDTFLFVSSGDRYHGELVEKTGRDRLSEDVLSGGYMVRDMDADFNSLEGNVIVCGASGDYFATPKRVLERFPLSEYYTRRFPTIKGIELQEDQGPRILPPKIMNPIWEGLLL